MPSDPHAAPDSAGSPIGFETQTPPELSVLIVTFNSGPDVIRCVDSLASGISVPHEVVVVDNASSDGSFAALTAAFPAIKAVPMTTNVGFARAVNAAMKVARAPYLLVLNPDTVVTAGAIDALLHFARTRTDLGMVAPRLRYLDGRDQATARSFPTVAAGIFGRRSPLTRRFPNNPWSRRFLSGLSAGEAPFRCDWVSGACMLVPREAAVQTGGFDERYFLFWEDADWCRRMSAKGLDVWTVPASVVLHGEGGSRKGWPAPVIRHFHRGAYIYWKTFEAPQAWNPSRWFAATALAARAALLIAAGKLPRRDSSDSPGSTLLEPVRKDALA